MEFVGQIGGAVDGLVSSGDYLYIARGHSLDVSDVRDKDRPKQVNQIHRDARIRALATAKNKLYLWENDGLRVADISDRASPKFEADSFHAIPGCSYEVEYVLHHRGRYLAFQFGEPHCGYQQDIFEILEDGALKERNFPVAFENGFLLTGVDGDEANPKPYELRSQDAPWDAPPVASFTLPPSSGYRFLLGLNYVAAASFAPSALFVVGPIVEGKAPPVRSLLAPGETVLECWLGVNKVFLFLESNPPGLGRHTEKVAFDLSDPARPVRVPNVDGWAHDNDDWTGSKWPGLTGGDFIAPLQPEPLNDPTKIRLIEAANPSKPTPNGFFAAPSVVDHICLGGHLAYLSAGRGGVHIYDVSDPVHPIFRGWIATQDDAASSLLSGSKLFVEVSADHQDPNARIAIYDVHDPSAPQFLGKVSMPGGCRNPVVNGDRLYVKGAEGLGIFDIANPSAPRLVVVKKGIQIDAVQGKTAICANQKLRILDVSDPDAPVVISTPMEDGFEFTTDDTSSPHRLFFRWPFAYTWGYPGPNLRVVDLSDPRHPSARSEMDLTATHMAVAENRLVSLRTITSTAGANYVELHVTDVSDPTAPKTLWGDDDDEFYHSTAYIPEASYVAIQGDYIYVAGYGGALIFKFHEDAPSPK